MNKLFLSLLVVLMPVAMASCCCFKKTCPVKEDASVSDELEDVQDDAEDAVEDISEATEEATH